MEELPEQIFSAQPDSVETSNKTDIESSPKLACTCDLDDIGEYYFESDHLALRGNNDYRNLLKTLAILEAQRTKAIEDIDKLYEIRDKSLMDPVEFVHKLQRKEELGIPVPQKIAQVPSIDWNMYSLSGMQVGSDKQKITRKSLNVSPGEGCSSQSSDKLDCSVVVRGRVYDESKPATFNKLWTAEEQRKLEDLLLKYPPEEIENRRWEKIAVALGNRTATQVASRVQKYFIKLAKAGLPVPGRMPNIAHNKKLASRRSHHRPNLFMMSSTFFASHQPPVYMTEGEEDYGNTIMSSADSEPSQERMMDYLSDDEIDDDIKSMPEFKELMLLKKLREERLHKIGLAQHVGFGCDRCNCNPILGTRWHCMDCPSDVSTDFCGDCVDCMHESGLHKADHRLEPVVEAFLDGDYMHFTGKDYNYLDPNYLPAT